ncbi:M48 family metallopeptidase [Pelosinus sp. IPA-1]|uniref:M48 family metallopeptidase n=1 Tax=Pelosinus sp. IPA-1 TaxID=3029569 RepID=UPI0024361735|nr:M48 family metallopeptidase [Pelosinus sp. IPA-1]GMA99872.1 hypothetical protein PIPA1_26720 [Pelosinus sp. IPA-1]
MDSLIHSKENFYFKLSLVISVLIYILLVISLVGIVYIVLGIIISFIAHGLFVGNIKGNGIKLSETQFPEVYQLSKEIASKMGLEVVPDIYIIQSGGMINAFATKFLGRSFVVLYSDVFELAYRQGEAELAFIICHEFAHLKRKHVSRKVLLFPSMFVPFLAQAYSRACEYTCDNFASYYQTTGAENGLLILAIGKKLYEKVNVQQYIKQAESDGGFWVRFSELLATHPNLPKRVSNIQRYIQAKE